MSALYAVAIVLVIVAEIVGTDGPRDFGQTERATAVIDNGVLPFWLEERANHRPAMHSGPAMAVAVLQAVGLAAVLLSIGGIFQTLNNNGGNPASLQTLGPAVAKVAVAEVNQLADSGFVASHGGVNYHPGVIAACGIAGVIEAFPKANGIHSEVWLSVLLGVGYLIKVKISHVLLWVRGFSKLQLTLIMYPAGRTCQENKSFILSFFSVLLIDAHV